MVLCNTCYLLPVSACLIRVLVSMDSVFLLRTIMSQYKLVLFFFFWLAWGVRASVRAPRLFLTAQWTPCKPSEQVRHRGDDRRTQRESNSGRQKETSPYISLEHDPQASIQVSSYNGRWCYGIILISRSNAEEGRGWREIRMFFVYFCVLKVFLKKN
jgi:hypothetical protein